MQLQRKTIDVHGAQVMLDLPGSLANHRLERIALTVDEEPSTPVQRRQPSPAIFAKGRTLGDIVSPIVDPEDWSELP